MKHDAIYLRVSTKQQNTKSQEPDLRRWAETQEGEVKWYSDKATGKNMDRPGWQKLETAIRAGKVAKVVVWRLDRLGRTAKGLTALFEELQQRKIGLISMKEGIDLSTPAGRMMANVIAAIAQYETELRGERILAGQLLARDKGKKWGGSVAGNPKKVTPTQLKMICAMKEQGEAITHIAEAVGLSRPTIYDVLRHKDDAMEDMESRRDLKNGAHYN